MRYYVSAIVHTDMLAWTHRPLRAKNPRHAEEKFLGKMGVRRNGRNYAERVVRWGNRNKSTNNLLFPKAYSEAWEAQMKRGLTRVV